MKNLKNKKIILTPDDLNLISGGQHDGDSGKDCSSSCKCEGCMPEEASFNLAGETFAHKFMD